MTQKSVENRRIAKVVSQVKIVPIVPVVLHVKIVLIVITVLIAKIVVIARKLNTEFLCFKINN